MLQVNDKLLHISLQNSRRMFRYCPFEKAPKHDPQYTVVQKALKQAEYLQKILQRSASQCVPLFSTSIIYDPSHLTDPSKTHEPAPSTAFVKAGPSPPSRAKSGVIPLLSMPQRSSKTSGRRPDRPFMSDTTLANIVARAAASESAESGASSAPPRLLLFCEKGFHVCI